jgi:hypothetical protein
MLLDSPVHLYPLVDRWILRWSGLRSDPMFASGLLRSPAHHGFMVARLFSKFPNSQISKFTMVGQSRSRILRELLSNLDSLDIAACSEGS